MSDDRTAMLENPKPHASPLRLSPFAHRLFVLHHHRFELIEKIARVVRAGGGFRVVLNAERWKRFMSKALQCLIIQIDVSDFDFGFGKRIDFDRKSMVLCGNFDLTRGNPKDWVVTTSMPEFQLIGASTQGQAQNLVTKTDAEDRFLAEQLPHRVDCVCHGLRIARTVGEKNPVGIKAQNLAGTRPGWHHGQFATMVCQQPKNVVFDAEIERNHFEGTLLLLLSCRIPWLSLAGWEQV